MTTPKSLNSWNTSVNITNQIAVSAICVVDRSFPPLADVANPNRHSIASRIQATVPPRLTFKINGKTVTESLPDPPATRKAEREIAEFRNRKTGMGNGSRSTRRSANYARLNRSASPEEKTAEAIQREVAREVDQLGVIFSGRRKSGHLDLEAIEMAVRSVMHHAGATALSELPQFPAPATEQRALPVLAAITLIIGNYGPGRF